MLLTFGTKFYLVDLYQGCSNYSPGVRKATPQGSLVLQTHLGENFKNLV